MPYRVEVLHENCGDCDYLAARCVMESQIMKREDHSSTFTVIPPGHIFPKIAHTAHAVLIDGEQDWKLVPNHMGCEECERVGQEAMAEAVERNAIWFSRTATGMSAPGVEDGNNHRVKAIRI